MPHDIIGNGTLTNGTGLGVGPTFFNMTCSPDILYIDITQMHELPFEGSYTNFTLSIVNNDGSLVDSSLVSNDFLVFDCDEYGGEESYLLKVDPQDYVGLFNIQADTKYGFHLIAPPELKPPHASEGICNVSGATQQLHLMVGLEINVTFTLIEIQVNGIIILLPHPGIIMAYNNGTEAIFPIISGYLPDVLLPLVFIDIDLNQIAEITAIPKEEMTILIRMNATEELSSSATLTVTEE